jgi:hypothetical protein
MTIVNAIIGPTTSRQVDRTSSYFVENPGVTNPCLIIPQMFIPNTMKTQGVAALPQLINGVNIPICRNELLSRSCDCNEGMQIIKTARAIARKGNGRFIIQ